MFITKSFSIILVYTLLATANGAGVHGDLSGMFVVRWCRLRGLTSECVLDSLARLEAIKANIAEAVNARDVNASAEVPPAVAYETYLLIWNKTYQQTHFNSSDISSIVTASTELAAAIVAHVTDLSSDPLDKRSTDNIRFVDSSSFDITN